MDETLERRRIEASQRFGRLQAELGTARGRASGKACVYVTGSFGRGEGGKHSDLDLFIVGRTQSVTADSSERVPSLKRLDEICLKADLIEATRRLDFPEFSGDGAYLQHYTVDQLVKSRGQQDDDSSNTFTARLLLLLESKALLGEDVYSQAIEDVISAYWGDYPDHSHDFVPAFLANDILRLWRTFCVNYEARTETDPPRKKAKRRLKNYKLKHSRLLTCYSALAYMLAVMAKERTVSADRAAAMVKLSPTERLEALVGDFGFAGDEVGSLLASYGRFLENTDHPESELIETFLDRSEYPRLLKEASAFGDAVATLLGNVGGSTALHRLLVV